MSKPKHQRVYLSKSNQANPDDVMKVREYLLGLGYEIIESEHPVVPLMIRDTKRTSELVQYLAQHGILATGLNYPVVPKGDEEIRFQVAADHTEYDIDYVLEILRKFVTVQVATKAPRHKG